MSKMKAPAISVIVPCYNVEQYIVACIEGLIAQTHEDFEVLCIDDGSADGTLELLHVLAARDPRITVVKNQQNIGAYLTRMVGIERAKGEFVTFVDADDTIEREHLSLLYSRALDGCDIVVGGYTRVDFNGDEMTVIPSSEHMNARSCLLTLWSDDYDSGMYQSWNKLYRRTVLNRTHFVRERIALTEDQIFNAQIFAAVPDARVGVSEVPSYNYMARHGSVVASISGQHIVDYFYALSVKSHFVLRMSILTPEYKRRFKFLVAKKLFDMYGMIYRSRDTALVSLFNDYVAVLSLPSYMGAIRTPYMWARFLKYVLRRATSSFGMFPNVLR